MKMSKESYNLILTAFLDNSEAIKEYKEWLIKNATYTNLNVRLGFASYRGLLTSEQRRHISESDNLKDNHLQTGILKALKQLDI